LPGIGFRGHLYAKTGQFQDALEQIETVIGKPESGSAAGVTRDYRDWMLSDPDFGSGSNYTSSFMAAYCHWITVCAVPLVY
jgi:hypothetical protein